MRKREAGFSSAGLVAGLASLGLAAMFVQNQHNLTTDKVKEAKSMESSIDKANLHLSNFSLLKASLQAAKRGKTYTSAIYPADYFADTWSFQENTDVKSKGMDLQGQLIKVNVLGSTMVDAQDISSRMEFSAKSSKSKADQTLSVYELKHDKTYPYWVNAVDVNSKIASGDKKISSANGRVHLDAPTPQDLKLAIKAPGDADFKIYGKDDTLPETDNPSGKYVFRVLGSGVVLYGELVIDGVVHPFGLDSAGKVTHPARNIKAVDKVIGEIEVPIEAKTTTTTSKSGGSDSSSGSGGSGSGDKGSGGEDGECKIGGDNASQFGQGIGTVPGGATTGSGSSGGSKSGGTTTTTTTTTIPTVISLSAKLFGVDGQEATDVTFKKSFTVGKKESKSTSSVEKGTVDKNKQTYDNCSEHCPINSISSFENNIESQATILDRAALAEPDNKKTDLFNPDRTASTIDTATIPGIICDNYDLAGKSMYVTTGLLASAMLKQDKSKYMASFEKYKSMYQSYIFIAPKCNRTVINDRTSCGCFAEDTLILMADGSEKAIRELRQGDLVWNPKAQKVQSIAKVIRGPENIPMYEVRVAGKSLSVTRDHPFLTELGLAPAHLLNAGQKIDVGGGLRPIENVRVIPVPEELPIVWNISLEGGDDEADHFVLAGGVMTGDLFIQEKLKAP